MKRLLVFVLVLIFIFTPYIVSAQGLDIPNDREVLEERYKEMAQIAQKYKELYEESNNNFQKLESKYNETQQNLEEYKELYEDQKLQTERALESNNRWQDLFETQSEIIDGLLNKKDISINTGVGVNLANPEESLIMLGFEIGL
jgi:Skp family chaperone for outer membrane proteins